MGFVVTIFSIVCLVIAWLRSRDRAGGSRSWRCRVKAMGWGVLLLPIAWIALWLFGVNPATVGLLLLCCLALILLCGLAAAFAVYEYARQGIVWAVPGKAAQASAAVHAKQAAISWKTSIATAV